jgi:hypothetical protein
VPRVRLASFDPQMIAKYQCRFQGLDEKIISMYARGMITRGIAGDLRAISAGSRFHRIRTVRWPMRCSTMTPLGSRVRWNTLSEQPRGGV